MLDGHAVAQDSHPREVVSINFELGGLNFRAAAFPDVAEPRVSGLLFSQRAALAPDPIDHDDANDEAQSGPAQPCGDAPTLNGEVWRRVWEGWWGRGWHGWLGRRGRQGW